MKKQLLLLSILISLTLASLMQQSYSSAAEKKPAFAKKCNEVTVGTSVYFSLKHVKKSYHVKYSSSNKRIAAIKKNTGKCTGINSGKCKIYAKIYNKKHRLIKTLKHPIRVIKSSLIPNASFHLVQSINPFNYTVKIGCNRILLKKEVQKSKITLIKNGNSSPLSASFSELSYTGKEITYVLNSQSQKKLCPRNGTMDGTYTLSCPLFRKKITLSYQERIGNHSLSGYVFSVEGSPINQAYVKCMSEGSIMTCRTDSNGFYHLKNVRNPISVTVAKSGFLTETLARPTTFSHATRCENFFLHREKESNFTAQFHIAEQGGTAIPKASVSLFPSDSENELLCSGETDKNGNILFYTDQIPSSAPCTKWSISHEDTLAYENHFTPDSANSIRIPPLSLDKNYTLLVGKSPKENTPGYPFRKFTFCPKDYLSQQFLFDVRLSNCNLLSLENLSLKWKREDNPLPSHLRLFFYQKQCQKPVLTVPLSEKEFTVNEHALSIPASIPYSLPDGSYYIKGMLEDEEHRPISQSSMTELSISGGKCSSRELSFLSSSYARILAYGDFSQTDIHVSFHRYEKVDGEFYYIDTLASSPFYGKKWDVKTANLILPCTHAETSYLLLPGEGEITPEEHLIFTAKKENIFSDEHAAIASLPLAKINCIPASESTSDIFPGIWAKEYTPPVTSHTNATKSYVRNCPSYPNSITVFRKDDGTFLSASLALNSSKKIISNNSHTIIDIYANGKELETTQKSYNLAIHLDSVLGHAGKYGFHTLGFFLSKSIGARENFHSLL